MIVTNKLERIEGLLDAAYIADCRTVNNNLAYGLSPDVADDDNTTALQIASAQGNLYLMQMLLNGGASVDKCNQCGFTPLLHAARNGKAQAIELLIRHGADPFRTTFYGTTALSLASAGGHVNVVAMLRKYASETRRRAPTPLMAAIGKKQYQTVIYLELAGIVRYPCRDMFYELDAFHVAEQLVDLKMIALLRDLGVQLMNPATYRFFSGTPTNQKSQIEITKTTVDIRYLIRDNKIALVDWIMDLNDYSVPSGTTPLMYAAITGSISMAQILLQHNCDINAACRGFTPIMIAAVCGNDGLTQYLMRKGASQSTNGFQFSFFELASNSDGISLQTIQLILTGSMHKMRLIERIPALLQRISRWRGIIEFVYHQPIKLETNSGKLSFLQKVIQNMGLKSNWVPEELFDILAWPDSPDSCFEVINLIYGSKAAPTPLLDCSPIRSSNLDEAISLINTVCPHVLQQQQCKSISKLQSILFHFGSDSPKNCSMTSSNSTNLSITLKTNDTLDSERSLDGSDSKLRSAYKHENEYWNFLNRRCSPDMYQKLKEQEVDYETFLMLTKAEFISLGISRTDAGILSIIQKMLEEKFRKI